MKTEYEHPTPSDGEDYKIRNLEIALADTRLEPVVSIEQVANVIKRYWHFAERVSLIEELTKGL
jgi:hypothetical protein